MPDTSPQVGTPTGQAPLDGTSATIQPPAATPASTGTDAAWEEERKALRAEAAQNRIKARDAQVELDRLKSAQAEADRKRAEQQGEYQKLYEAEKAAHTAAVAAFKGRILSERLASLKLAHGIPADYAEAVAVPLDGIEVGDDFTVPETLAERVKAVAEKFKPLFAKPAEPPAPAAPVKPTVIGERKNADKPEPQRVTLEGSGRRLTEKLLKSAGLAPAPPARP